VTNTSLELIKLALSRVAIEPTLLAPKDMEKNRVWFAVSE
jgi:hypothetical protein